MLKPHVLGVLHINRLCVGNRMFCMMFESGGLHYEIGCFTCWKRMFCMIFESGGLHIKPGVLHVKIGCFAS